MTNKFAQSPGAAALRKHNTPGWNAHRMKEALKTLKCHIFSNENHLNNRLQPECKRLLLAEVSMCESGFRFKFQLLHYLEMLLASQSSRHILLAATLGLHMTLVVISQHLGRC